MGKMANLCHIDDAELGQVLRGFTQYTTQAQAKINLAVRTTTRKGGNSARQKAPFNPLRATGKHLKQSIKTSVKLMRNLDGQAVGTVKAAAPHAHLLEFGVKPHQVAPKKRKAMRINANGVVRYTNKPIGLPGFGAKPFMLPAFNEHKESFIREVKAAIK